MPSPPLIKRDTVIGLTIAFATVAALSAAAEFTLRKRAAGAHARLRQSVDTETLCTAPSDNPRLIYTYVPGTCGVNGNGYVDRERAQEAPAGTFRILIIGDSIAQGRDVKIEDRFGAVLERLLNEPSGGGVEVIVLARVGYSTGQELVILQEEAMSYAPNLILWSYCLNDPAHPVYHNANGQLGAFYYRPRSYLVEAFRRLAFVMREKWRGRACGKDGGEFHARLHCVYWNDVERDLGTIGAFAAKNKVPIVLMIHPVFEEGETFANYSLGSLHRRLAEAASDAGLYTLDLLDTLAPYAPDDIKIHNERYYDPWHFNTRGHELTALGIQRYLVGKHLVR